MPYRLPEFPLEVNLWHGPVTIPPAGGPDITFSGNLMHGRRVTFYCPTGNFPMQLLCPWGTELRGEFPCGNGDVVEVPAGTGRYYRVVYADYSAAGFANQHVFGVLERLCEDEAPPTPGDDCPTAATIELGTEYGYSISGEAQQWFTFPIETGTEYHITIAWVTEDELELDCYAGISCDDRVFQFILGTEDDCDSFTAAVDGFCFFWVESHLGESGSYTFTADVGPC